MTVVVDKGDLLTVSDESPIVPGIGVPPTPGREPPLEIGVLNNMPDGALQATERQYIRLFQAAAGDRLVRLHFYSLPGVVRSAEGCARIKTAYDDIESLKTAGLDGLIVTGAEPKTERLSDETYWLELSSIIEWAKLNTASTIWSCLAAHAAVLHLDRIERRRFARKCSGVFASARVSDDPLVDGLRWPLRIFHSRHNDLAESDLAANGYRVITRVEGAGVDIFVKQYQSRFVFFQGHPEYDPLSLRGEYLRDVTRYLNGKQDSYPAVPADYFDSASVAALESLRERAIANRDPALASTCRDILERSKVTYDGRGAAKTIFRNWLTFFVGARTCLSGKVSQS